MVGGINSATSRSFLPFPAPLAAALPSQDWHERLGGYQVAGKPNRPAEVLEAFVTGVKGAPLSSRKTSRRNRPATCHQSGR
jgi:hypothetical protein